ncbi:MAG: right-handed parallel beta-helix repeat-containing protein [Candidatus Electrothrix scaldis]|nr:MAG: right-handed parallel beta-helix repeat-containing protein [Candidatus Electrothrix sp. GW3-3]
MKRNVFLLLFILVTGFVRTSYAATCVQISIEPTEAREAGAQFEVEDGGLFWRQQSYDSNAKACYLSSGPTRVRGTEISGWEAEIITVDVVEDKTAQGTLRYTKTSSATTGSVEITIEPVEARNAGATWGTMVDGIGWWGPAESGEEYPYFPTGPKIISFSDISGWQTPDDITITVIADKLVEATVTYSKDTSGPETGSVKVTIYPSDAIDAGGKWEARPSGGTWQGPYSSGQTVGGFPVGTVNIRFVDISGWNTPDAKNITVSADSPKTTSGTYTQDSPTTGSVQVTINPSEAVSAGAKWEVMIPGIGWEGPFSSGRTVTGLQPGNTTVRFTDVTGWVTPAEQTVNIVAGDTATASGEYSQHIEKPDVCIGHDYEQQTPLAGVTPPTVEISGNSAVNEQAELSLSATSTVDTAKGGSRFYYWCAEKGLLQADPAHPDYSQVKFIAPKVAGSDEDIRIYAKVGDTLGYVGRDIFHVNVAERGNYDASDPAPTVSVSLPDILYAGRPFRILYTIADALFAARAEMSAPVRMQAMAAEMSESAAAVEEPASDLYTDMYISTDGGDFVQVVKGLRGESGAYTIIPPSVTENFAVKVVVTDGNSTVEKIIDAPAVQPWYEISGYCSDGENGEPIPNCLVQAAEGGRALSDYTGGFELTGLAEGSFTVSAGHADYYFEPRKVSLALSKDHSSQDVSFTGYPLTDDDDDGMPDIWEEKYFGDLSQDGNGDFDQDGLADLDEFYQGTDPTLADSDADGIPDGWEVLHGLDPLTDDSGDDPDNDGFSNYEEYDAGTDPNDASSHPVVCHFRVPGDYDTLTLAVLAGHGRADGAAVCVGPGTYEENIELLDKVWLVAESKDPAETVILGNGTKDVITMNHVDSGGVVGFTITSKGKGKKNKTQADGIVFKGASQRAVIARNIITGTRNAVVLRGNVSPLIMNNTVVGNQSDGIEVSGNSPAQVQNNIVADNAGYGIVRNGHAIDVIAYNDAFGNSKADYRKTEMGDGGLNADPLFTDGYRLGAGSPCLDAGRTLEGAVTDIGAYGGNTAALVYGGYVPGPPDSDEDGISDDWEMRYFADLTAADAASDHDGDGYSDYAEYVNSVNGAVDPDGSGFDPLAENAAGGEGWESGEPEPWRILPFIYELLLKGDRVEQ